MSVNPGFGGQRFIPRSDRQDPRACARCSTAPAAAPSRSRRRHRSRHGARGRRGRGRRAGRRPCDLRSRRPDRRRRGAAASRRCRRRWLSRVRLRPPSPTPAGRPHVSHVRVRYAETDRWASSTTPTTSSGSRSAAPTGCAPPAGPTAQHGSRRAGPAGHRGALRVQVAGALRRRRSRCARRRGWCRRCGWPSTTTSCGGRAAAVATGYTVHATLDAPGRPGAAAGARQGTHRMKALVTGGAGFIGSHLSERLLDAGRGGGGHRLLHRLLPARHQGAQRRRAARGGRVTGSSRRPSPTPICRRCSTASRHVFHLAAQAGVRKSWGRDFRIYTELNVDATQILLEACVGRPIERVVYASSSSVYGDRRDAADAGGRPAAAGVAVRRDQAGGRAALPPLFRQSRRADGVAALLHRLRPAAAARHGLSPVLLGGRSTGGRSSSSATGCRPGTSPSWPTPSPPRPTAAVRGVPGRVYNIGGGSRVTLREVFELIGRVSGRPRDHRRPAPSERRHARHLRRHDPGPGRPRLCAVGRPWNRA